MQGNYYQKAMLNFVIKESDPLFNNFVERGNKKYILLYNSLILYTY